MVTLTTAFLEKRYLVMLVKWPPKYGRAVEFGSLILALQSSFDAPLPLFFYYNQNPDRKLLFWCVFPQICSVQAPKLDASFDL